MSAHPEPRALLELRRDYHDRIAALRSLSIAIVAQAADGADATVWRLGLGDDTRHIDGQGGREVTVARVADVEAEVLSLLALQAPVARDLRVILSSRDIAHLGELCVGLVEMLSASAGRVRDALSPDLRDRLCRIAHEGAGLLRSANAAWIGMDEAQARQVIEEAGQTRHLLRTFSADVASLTHVPVDAAVELGRTIRACERLSDHAVEIADRVLFASIGATSGSALDALSD